MNADAARHDAHGTAPADTLVDRHAAAYDSQPWLCHAPDAPDLAAPRRSHRAALVREGPRRPARRRRPSPPACPTACMSRRASLSFAELDALSDASAAWLREGAGVQACAVWIVNSSRTSTACSEPLLAPRRPALPVLVLPSGIRLTLSNPGAPHRRADQSPRTTSVSQSSKCSRFSAVLPRRARARPLRPCEPSTTRSTLALPT